jgi:hypothetical protein
MLKVLITAPLDAVLCMIPRFVTVSSKHEFVYTGLSGSAKLGVGSAWARLGLGMG